MLFLGTFFYGATKSFTLLFLLTISQSCPAFASYSSSDLLDNFQPPLHCFIFFFFNKLFFFLQVTWWGCCFLVLVFFFFFMLRQFYIEFLYSPQPRAPPAKHSLSHSLFSSPHPLDLLLHYLLIFWIIYWFVHKYFTKFDCFLSLPCLTVCCVCSVLI